MAEHVEGDWKNFTFKMAEPEDYPKILEHLRQNLYRDEPQNKHSGQNEERLQDNDNFGTKYLKQGLSFFVYDRDNNNKIVGTRVTGISRKRKDADTDLLAMKVRAPETENLMVNIVELLEEANTYEKLGIDHYGDFLFVSVDREYRGQGIAKEMYNRAIRLLKSIGVPAAQSIFTNPASQHIARELGFEELARKYLKDYKKLDGSVMFPEAEDDEVAIVMAKLF